HGARRRRARRDVLRARDHPCVRARPGHLRRAGAQARAGGNRTGSGRCARLRERTHGTDLPRAARLDGDRAPARAGAALPVPRGALALPAPEQRAAFASLGFVPTTYTLHFVGKPLAGRLDTDPRAWRFTLGDTDFF